MPREKEAYRDNLERLNEAFPDKELLRIKDVAEFCGICTKHAAARFPFKDRYISKAVLARALS